MKWVLFIDDLRDVLDVITNKDHLAMTYMARDSQEAWNLVEKYGVPSVVYFDHDLGGDDTSIRFINRLIEHDMNNDIIKHPFEFVVHSANPVGVQNIKGKLDCYFAFKFDQKI